MEFPSQCRTRLNSHCYFHPFLLVIATVFVSDAAVRQATLERQAMPAIQATFAWLLLMNGNCLPNIVAVYLLAVSVMQTVLLVSERKRLSGSKSKSELCAHSRSFFLAQQLNFYLWFNVDSLSIVVISLHVFINSVSLLSYTLLLLSKDSCKRSCNCSWDRESRKPKAVCSSLFMLLGITLTLA